MNHQRMTQTEVCGLLVGVLGAIVLLVALSVRLLQPEDTSAKVLVAVWLWSLPVLGIGAFVGWSLARLYRRVKP